MRSVLTRRQFLALPFGLFFVQARARAEEPARSVLDYDLHLAVLFDLLNFKVSGSVVADVERRLGRYRVTMAGQGTGISTRTEAVGVIRAGRFNPTETRSTHRLRGRESWVVTTYDYDRGQLELHGVSHTLVLGRRRQVDDVLPLPPGQHVDDLVSAVLNFADNTLDREPDGTYRALIVRRARADTEGPDDVSPGGYRAELVPLRFKPTEASSGRLTASIDVTRFSSWARADHPARVTFTHDRQLESIYSPLILGSSLQLRVTSSTWASR